MSGGNAAYLRIGAIEMRWNSTASKSTGVIAGIKKAFGFFTLLRNILPHIA